MKEDILPYLEWEVLREPITIPKVDDIKELPKGQKKIVINRNEHYKLRAVLSTRGDSEFFTKETEDIVPGSFVEPFEITGSDQRELRHYTLESCYLGGTHCEIGEETLCETDLGIQGLRIKHKTEAEGVWFIEWYINGPRDRFIFSNSTMRKMSKTFFRERLATNDEKIHSIEVPGEILSHSKDCLRIKACDIQFLVTQVPEGIGPEWSSSIGIEYRKDWGRVPDVDEREKISELCSFIFGRQLLSVGYTIYDKDGHIVEEYACNPWGNNISSLCSEPDIAPIKISDPFRGKAEDIISRLLPQYYALRNPLNLKDALWRYWIARNVPVGTDLPIFAAAVETIMNGWFNSNKTKSRGVYMNNDEFENLLHEDIVAIKSKLNSKPHGDKVMKNIQNAYQMGVTDAFRFFFEEINLDINKNEWAAIEARHKIAHGRIVKNKKEWRLFVQHSKSYETLVSKILLRLLGYSGSYIDRSNIGWPEKQLVWGKSS